MSISARRFAHLSLVALCSFAGLSCGALSPGTPPTPTVTSITITGPTFVRIGVPQEFRATARLSNTLIQDITSGTWGTDVPAAATAEASTGRVTGVASGEVTVIVDYQGQRGTLRIRVVPNYQGGFSGDYIIRGCTHRGGFAVMGFCSQFPTGTIRQISLQSSQTDDRVSSTVILGQVSTPVDGRIQTNGLVQFTGAPVISGTTRLDIDSFFINQTDTAGNQISGTFVLVFKDSLVTGDGRVVAEIRTLTRVSALMPAGLDAHRFLSEPHDPAFTIRELVQVLRQRR